MKKKLIDYNDRKNEKKNGLINFINSLDFMNKDILNNKDFQEYRNNDEIIDEDNDLKNYIIEFNNKIGNKNICIKNEKILFK
jgi:hypothetical protein